MKQQTISDLKLVCKFQDTRNFGCTNAKGSNVAIPGMLSDTGKGTALFEETIPRKREFRNNRLYEGTYVNVVRRKDGLYYPFLKAFNPQVIKDRGAYVIAVCNELNKAIYSIK